MTTPPRRLTPGDRRRQILDTARKLLDVKNLVEITVDEAARLAGVSPGLVFHYFGSQLGFRSALAEEAAAELLSQMEPDPACSHAEQLRRALDRLIVYAEQHPRLYVAVTSDANTDAREAHQGIVEVASGWVLAALRDVGVPETPALAAAVFGWLAFTEKVVQGWLAEPRRMTRDEIADLCEKTCYHVLQVIVADPGEWLRVEQALSARPDVPGQALTG
ncbi:MAG: TetR/AcrR family transcriptional regulator [Nocardiopsaceae bacterium]|nr:TetR/AcrR family transcriptional regulator [Nocardiopsaceae bacterium]